MSKLRGLVVDDAAVIRRLVCEALARDAGVEVAGVASNGRIALQKLTQLNPDFITLDLEMPELNGLETLREIRRTHPNLPVIMFSLATRRGAGATLDALAAGANDYVTKPVDAANLDESIGRLSEELLPKIHAHCHTVDHHTPTAAAAPPPRASSASPARAIELVCIGASTGGPNALGEVFSRLSQAITVPIAIVQHMPPVFTQMLAEKLNTLSRWVRCHEVADGQVLEPGHAYLAPGGRHLVLERNAASRFVARLTDTPPENSCRPAVDVLFRSAAALAGSSTLAVIMTGMGQDGLRGAERIHEAGGRIIAQDRATSIVWGMPGKVATAGLAQAVLPVTEIGGCILNCVAGAARPSIAR